jgi:hypothetical protein
MRNGIVKIATDSRGNYRRDLGRKRSAEGKPRQQRFYLGRDFREATVRYLKLGNCWSAVEKRWQTERLTEQPLWDVATLHIALCVSRGDAECVIDAALCKEVSGPKGQSKSQEVDPGSRGDRRSAEQFQTWFGKLQTDFGSIIPLRLAVAEEAAAETEDQVRHFRHRVAETGKLAVGPQTLHVALAAFADWYRAKYQDADGRPSEYANSCCDQIATLVEHAEDIPLSGFGRTAIEGLIDCWRNRPVLKRGNRATAATAVSHIKRIRSFIRWLHKSRDFDWQHPFDYEVIPVRISSTSADMPARYDPPQAETYTADELATLWQYAIPRERLLTILALNCGFGQRELGRLQQEEVFLNQPHGHVPGLFGSWIKRFLRTPPIYGEWQLWPETEAALAWYMRHRPETEESALLVNANGKALVLKTKGNNRNGSIANAWLRLLDRVCHDQPGFRRLSFNKLRKTGARLVREMAGGEVADIYACQRPPKRSNSRSELRNNRGQPFTKLFSALALVRENLSQAFAAVHDPFPEEAKKGNGGCISPRMVERVAELRQQGLQYAQIAEALGIGKSTVTKYVHKAGLQKRSWKWTRGKARAQETFGQG